MDFFDALQTAGFSSSSRLLPTSSYVMRMEYVEWLSDVFQLGIARFETQFLVFNALGSSDDFSEDSSIFSLHLPRLACSRSFCRTCSRKRPCFAREMIPIPRATAWSWGRGN